jgi:predicted GNAT family acetyltransferase
VIRDDQASHRYVAEIDGNRVGMAVYHLRDGRYFFVHTEVDTEHEGQGIGTRLVREALDDVRDRGGLVVPICPLFAAYIDVHQEYDAIVDHDIMNRLEGKAPT